MMAIPCLSGSKCAEPVSRFGKLLAATEGVIKPRKNRAPLTGSFRSEEQLG
jgi:hypothetical protein